MMNKYLYLLIAITLLSACTTQPNEYESSSPSTSTSSNTIPSYDPERYVQERGVWTVDIHHYPSYQLVESYVTNDVEQVSQEFLKNILEHLWCYYFKLSITPSSSTIPIPRYEVYSNIKTILTQKAELVGNRKMTYMPQRIVVEKIDAKTGEMIVYLGYLKEAFENTEQVELSIPEFGLGTGDMKFGFEAERIVNAPTPKRFNLPKVYNEPRELVPVE